jgi:putative membrane protein
MKLIVELLIGFTALLHLYFLWLEMFAWTSRGPKVFKGFPRDLFEPTKTLAANQGLYNGFLAAGLIWSLLIENHPWKIYIAIFFLTCVVIAGVFGAITASKKIFFVQGLPALIALILIHLH